MSMTRGDLVAERASDRDAAQRADRALQEGEAELAALKPATNKERDTDAYLERRDALQDGAAPSRARPAIGARRLGADPGAIALAAYAAALGVEDGCCRRSGYGCPLIGVLALELGAAFSVVLVRSVAGAEGGARGARPFRGRFRGAQ